MKYILLLALILIPVLGLAKPLIPIPCDRIVGLHESTSYVSILSYVVGGSYVATDSIEITNNDADYYLAKCKGKTYYHQTDD